MEFLAASLGWPAILLALILSVIGVTQRKPVLALLAAGLLLPITFYLIGSPRIAWLGLLIPAGFVGAWAATWKGKTEAAWLCLAPVFAVVGWLAVLVVSAG